MSAYYSNRLSYEEVEELIERMTGQRALSDQVQEYSAGTPESPLNIVAIVDRARSIRCRLESLFGASVPVILDGIVKLSRSDTLC